MELVWQDLGLGGQLTVMGPRSEHTELSENPELAPERIQSDSDSMMSSLIQPVRQERLPKEENEMLRFVPYRCLAIQLPRIFSSFMKYCGIGSSCSKLLTWRMCFSNTIHYSYYSWLSLLACLPPRSACHDTRCRIHQVCTWCRVFVKSFSAKQWRSLVQRKCEPDASSRSKQCNVQ